MKSHMRSWAVSHIFYLIFSTAIIVNGQSVNCYTLFFFFCFLIFGLRKSCSHLFPIIIGCCRPAHLWLSFPLHCVFYFYWLLLLCSMHPLHSTPLQSNPSPSYYTDSISHCFSNSFPLFCLISVIIILIFNWINL